MRPRDPLLLVGASGLAREVAAVVRATGSHDLVGVVDDDPQLRGNDVGGLPILGGLDLVAAHPTAKLVLCVGRGSARAAMAARLEVGADRYAVVRHPSADVPAGCRVGAGSVVLAHVAVTADVRIGCHVVVMPNVTITHDDVVSDYATLCAGVSLGGWVVVGEGAYLGMNASVRERTVIGAGATVGMGAAVLADVPTGATWAGVPAGPLVPPGDARLLHRAHGNLPSATHHEGVRT